MKLISTYLNLSLFLALASGAFAQGVADIFMTMNLTATEKILISRTDDKNNYAVGENKVPNFKEEKGEVVHSLSICYEVFNLSAEGITIKTYYIMENPVKNGDYSIDTEGKVSLILVSKEDRDRVTKLYQKVSAKKIAQSSNRERVIKRVDRW